jgi:hypothetical protein
MLLKILQTSIEKMQINEMASPIPQKILSHLPSNSHDSRHIVSLLTSVPFSRTPTIQLTVTMAVRNSLTKLKLSVAGTSKFPMKLSRDTMNPESSEHADRSLSLNDFEHSYFSQRLEETDMLHRYHKYSCPVGD